MIFWRGTGPHPDVPGPVEMKRTLLPMMKAGGEAGKLAARRWLRGTTYAAVRRQYWFWSKRGHERALAAALHPFLDRVEVAVELVGEAGA